MTNFQVEATVDIDAPLAQVWRIMLDTASYQDWNPFVVRADCPSPPTVGDPIVLTARWHSGRTSTSPERISVVEGPVTDATGTTTATLAYTYRGWPSRFGLVRSTRTQRLNQPAGGPTGYASLGEFSGPLARLAGPGRIAVGFREHADALKARAESPTP